MTTPLDSGSVAGTPVQRACARRGDLCGAAARPRMRGGGDFEGGGRRRDVEQIVGAALRPAPSELVRPGPGLLARPRGSFTVGLGGVGRAAAGPGVHGERCGAGRASLTVDAGTGRRHPPRT